LPADEAGVGLGGQDTRVLLIGTGDYQDSGLEPVPAVPATLADLGQVLIERCGLARENLRVLCDPASPADMGLAVAEEAERAQGVLIVYYVGHGLVSTGRELYLAAANTDRRTNRLAHTALAYTAARNSLLDSPARSVVVILDCCFSGRAVGTLAGAGDSTVAADLAQVSGSYVLTSAAREELALAPEGATHTAFTGELIRLLRDGDPDGPPQLALSHVYRYLSRVLPARGFPKPQRRASDWIDDLVLAPNPAYRLPGYGRPGDGARDPDMCPFPGLAAFRTEQAQWFFGRERLTSELVGRLAARLDQAVPLVVVGASGSGKTSLLRAGLLPTLAAGTVLGPGSRTWPHVLFTPTADPVGALAARTARLAGEDPATVRAELVARPDEFAAIVRRALRAQAEDGRISGARVVLVVDQFEETFTQCTDEGDRQAFIRALASAAHGAGDEPPALVILTVRADLYGACSTYPELESALQDGQVVVGLMRTPELRAAIQRPAAVAGLTLQAGLVETLLGDLGVTDAPADGRKAGNGKHAGNGGYDPGALPLLSHALRVTWEHRDRESRTLTLTGYNEAGGIRGAVATTAELAFEEFGAAEQQAARRLLLSLVQIGEGVAETRRRADRDTLVTEAPDPTAAAAVLDALARARLITADAGTVEITHEALLRAWPRLRAWIDADRAGLYVHQQLTRAAHAWDRRGRPAADLYRGAALAGAGGWAEDSIHQGDLSPAERDFLDASQALRVRQERRRARRPRRLTAALAVLLMFMAADGALYYREHRRAPSPAATVLDRQPVNSVAYSPDGRTLAIAGTDGTARLRDVATGRTTTLNTSDVAAVAFSPDGRSLATGSTDTSVLVWDLATDTSVMPMNGPAPVNAVAFSPDGRTLATGSTDGKARLWDVATGSDELVMSASGSVNAVAFSPDGHALATGSTDGTAQLWNTATGDHRTVKMTGPAVNAVAFSPDGQSLATGSSDGTARLWDAPIGRPGVTMNTADPVNAVAFSPDGHTLATGSSDGTARLWDAATGRAGVTMSPADPVNAVAFSPDGRTLAIGSTYGTVLWDVAVG
jgi:Caspase domain/WD domain, G-beta repeat